MSTLEQLDTLEQLEQSGWNVDHGQDPWPMGYIIRDIKLDHPTDRNKFMRIVMWVTPSGPCWQYARIYCPDYGEKWTLDEDTSSVKTAFYNPTAKYKSQTPHANAGTFRLKHTDIISIASDITRLVKSMNIPRALEMHHEALQ